MFISSALTAWLSMGAADALIRAASATQPPAVMTLLAVGGLSIPILVVLFALSGTAALASGRKLMSPGQTRSTALAAQGLDILRESMTYANPRLAKSGLAFVGYSKVGVVRGESDKAALIAHLIALDSLRPVPSRSGRTFEVGTLAEIRAERDRQPLVAQLNAWQTQLERKLQMEIHAGDDLYELTWEASGRRVISMAVLRGRSTLIYDHFLSTIVFAERKAASKAPRPARAARTTSPSTGASSFYWPEPDPGSICDDSQACEETVASCQTSLSRPWGTTAASADADVTVSYTTDASCNNTNVSLSGSSNYWSGWDTRAEAGIHTDVNTSARTFEAGCFAWVADGFVTISAQLGSGGFKFVISGTWGGSEDHDEDWREGEFNSLPLCNCYCDGSC